MSQTRKQVVVIGGPTGGGKDTVVARLLADYPQFVRLTTATTRSPRAYEKHERDYYFMTSDEFKQALERGDIVEHTYFANRDEYYGTYRPDLEKKIAEGKVPIAVTDRVGAEYMKKHYGAATIMVVPTPFETLHERFLSRDPNLTEEWIAKRIENAREEIELGKGHFDYTVENAYGKFEETIEEVYGILKKEGYIDEEQFPNLAQGMVYSPHE
jgi:guanylate kinase